MESNSLTSTIQRTLAILELFLENKESITAQEIVDQTGISRSTVFSMLKVLKDLDYLEQRQNRGPYSVGRRFSAWSGASSPTFQTLINAFQQEVGASEFSETIALVVASTRGNIVLNQVESKHIIRAVYATTTPLNDQSAANLVLTKKVDSEIIKNGYALIEDEESVELAVPICADGYDPSAALLVKAPISRSQAETLLSQTLNRLRVIAARLSYRLGAVTYAPFQSQSGSFLKPTEPLTERQIDQFLQGPWTARLACIRPDGNPHVIPVWQEWDGQAFHILAWRNSQWADYVAKNPQVSLTIDEPWAPLRRVVCNGKALPNRDKNTDASEELISRLALRYLGKSAPIIFHHQIEEIFTIKAENLRGWMGLPTGNEAK